MGLLDRYFEDGEAIEAFADPVSLANFFDVTEGAAGFRWRTLIETGSGQFLVEDFSFEDGVGWTWRDYYRVVRQWFYDMMLQLEGEIPEGRRSPFGTSVLSGKPKGSAETP